MTGLALAGIFLASAISNPLFGGLSDRGRIRWTCSVLLLAAGMMAIFPHLPGPGLIPALVIYGFFFLASYPMVEAAIMEAVPDAVRGRVFGLFITVGGLVGNLAHWVAGNWVRRLGDGASLPHRYFPLYEFLSLLVVLALAGLPCLHAIRKREHLEPASASAAAPVPVLRAPHSP
jgi:MFS family permease